MQGATRRHINGQIGDEEQRSSLRHTAATQRDGFPCGEGLRSASSATLSVGPAWAGRQCGAYKRRPEERLAQTLAGCPRVWYVRSREWDNDPDGELSSALGRMYRETTRLEGLPGVVIVTYER